MGTLQEVWAVAETETAIRELTAGAATLGRHVTLVCAGGREWAAGAETAYYLGETRGQSFLNYIPAVVTLIQSRAPGLVLFDTSRNGRLCAAAAAAALGVSVLTDSVELTVEEGGVTSRRLVYGGMAYLTERSTGPTAVACVGGGVFEAPAEAAPAAQVVEVPPVPPAVTFLGPRPRQAQRVNLGAARRVVSVGRGFGRQENVALARALAEALDGELGCSRPVAEECGWLPKEAYVGVSGAMIKPELYLACGISGQIQHMAGVSRARTIVAVNRDKSAPIFQQCDYGIVGDLTKILPALTQRLKDR